MSLKRLGLEKLDVREETVKMMLICICKNINMIPWLGAREKKKKEPQTQYRERNPNIIYLPLT